MGKEKDMKQSQQITPVEAKTTFVDVWRWGQELGRFHAHCSTFSNRVIFVFLSMSLPQLTLAV
jgi:hypothetical protein